MRTASERILMALVLLLVGCGSGQQAELAPPVEECFCVEPPPDKVKGVGPCQEVWFIEVDGDGVPFWSHPAEPCDYSCDGSDGPQPEVPLL